MCGIAGYIGKNRIDEGRISATLNRMINRGPDHQAFRIFQEQDRCVYLLHSRLSIIDLDPRAHQPLTIGNTTVIFNGEIYNYLEIQAELEKKGVVFQTMSDTEVLLQCYRVYGEECVDHFEGMWAFAIYDRAANKLFLSRDRFAEKPFYFMKTQDGFFFASEIKFISTLSGKSLTINKSHLFRYLVNGYKSLYKASDTYFQEIGEIPFGTNVTIGKDLQPRTYRYWQPRPEPQEMSLEAAVAGTRQWLTESIRIRLRADVPLAFCLSGGVDSASLASMASKSFGYRVVAFSIVDKDERYNEYDNIMATVRDLGCPHKIIEIGEGGFFERLRSLIAYHDAPLATISYYVHAFLSEAISQAGFKVAVSGTAADELFTGYYDHFNLHLYEMRQDPAFTEYVDDWQRHIAPIVRNPYMQNPKMYFDQPGIRAHIYLNRNDFAATLKEEFLEDFFEESYCESLLRNRMLNELFHESIPVILHEDDLNSMYYSIENRSPFLDSRLFTFAYSIPARHLIHDGYGKYVLREAVRGILNEQVRTDRRKVGFNASINSLVDFNKKDVREYLLDDGPIYDDLRKDRIEKMMAIHPMPNSVSKFIFNFINAKMFLEMSGNH